MCNQGKTLLCSDFSRMSNGPFLLTVSKALARSTKVMYSALFCSLDLFWIHGDCISEVLRQLALFPVPPCFYTSGRMSPVRKIMRGTDYN